MGYFVVINYASNGDAAAETLRLVNESGGEGELLQFDVADRQQVRNVLQQWMDRHADGYIEVLVNNAGIRHDSTMMLMDDGCWDSVIDVSLNGFYNVTQPLLLPMLAHRYGRIINMASLSGVKGMTGQTNYSAAKGGLIAATKALAQEVARRGVTVNAVAPGFIDTDMVSGLDTCSLRKLIPAGRFGTPAEVAAVVAFLAGCEAAYVTGNVVAVNGGLYT